MRSQSPLLDVCQSSCSNSSVYDDDQLVINYKDACIYGRDWKLFLDGGWLNDACLHYQFQRLKDKEEQEEEHGFSSPGELLLMDPAVISCFVHQCETDEEGDDFASGYHGFQSTRRWLIPINNTMTQNNTRWNIPGEQGTHWSLLVLERLERHDGRLLESSSSCPLIIKGYHMDSVPQSGNAVAANAVANKMQALLWRTLSTTIAATTATTMRSKHVRSPPPPPPPPLCLHECRVPRQHNGYDCGMHVLATAEALLTLWQRQRNHPHDVDDDDNQLRADWAATIGDRLADLFPSQNPAAHCADLRRTMARDILERAAASKKNSV